MKRVLSLCLLMTLILTSCGSNSVGDETTAGESTTSTAPETIDPAFESALPAEYDLGGYEITVARRSHEKNYWALGTFAFAEETGEALDDAIYRRNLAATEKYNFTLKEVNFDSDPVDKVNASVLAGDDEYRIAMIEMSSASKAVGGSYLNLYDLEWLAPEKAWWDQNIQRDLTVNGRLYMLTGDILVADNDAMMMTMYNRPLADDYKFENLYDAVRDGRWTYDLMISLAKQVSGDLNGDGKYDENDRYGLMYVNNASAEPYFASTCTYLYQIRNGEPEFIGDSEKAHDVFEMMNKILSDNTVAYDWNNIKQNISAKIAEMIGNKQVLFQNMVLSFVRRNYRDIELDFGLLPLPKYDEKQENYSTMINLSTPFIFVPASVTEPDKVGFALEALAEASGNITDTYYSVCMESKYTRDAESYEMIELACENIVYDPGFVYNWGRLGSTIKTAIMTGNSNYASLIAQNATASKTAMEDFMKELD